MMSGEKFRLRVKVLDLGGKRYMCAAGMYDVRSGQICAIATSDEDTRPVTMTAKEWDQLPWHTFEDLGPSGAGPTGFNAFAAVTR